LASCLERAKPGGGGQPEEAEGDERRGRFQAPERTKLVAGGGQKIVLRLEKTCHRHLFFVFIAFLLYNYNMETQNYTLAGRQIALFIRDNVDRSVSAEIYKHREYRRSEKAIIDAEKAIIDAGAHAGFFSIYCRILNSRVRIIALEPEPKNYDLLLKNLALNKIADVDTVPAALSGLSGKAKLLLAEDSHNHALIAGSNNKPGQILSVNAISLGDLVKKYKIKIVDLLKMDIEGGEYDVIENLSSFDFGQIKNIVFEYHNWGGKNYRRLEIILRENGFGVEIFPSKFDKKLGFIFASNKKIRGK